MMKRFSTIIFAILTLMGSSASVPSTPDFAFPEKVSSDARRAAQHRRVGGKRPGHSGGR